MKITVLGMGRMGQALAGRLMDGGHELVVWNRTQGKAPELLERGAREVGSIADAVAAAELVITSLANDDVVRSVALGDDGIRRSASDELVYVDASTISPELSRQLDTIFSKFVQMPILGSPALVASGKAVYLVGGDPGAVAAVESLLGCLTATVHRYDSPALAATGKLAVNLLLLDGIVALAESFTVGRAGGLSDEQLRDLLSDNNMVAPGMKNRFDGVLTGDQEPLWSPGLGAKDAGLAVELVREAGGEIPSTATVRDLYDRVADSGASGDDIVAVRQLYDR